MNKSNRYEEVTDSVRDVLLRVRKEHFPELVNAKIKPLFDTKKRVSGGMFMLAKIMLPSELIKHFTADEADGIDNGYDYIIIIDKVCWENSGETDKERLLRHELRHTFMDIDSDNPYKLVDHDVTDFYDEMELNRDDPRWRERLASLMEAVYEQMKDDAKRRGKRPAMAYTGPTPIEEEDMKKRESKEE